MPKSKNNRLISSFSIIFLLTCSTILFEISLSRLFSYMLNYHFVLIIIAFSILGLGIGNLIYARYLDKIDPYPNRWYGFLPLSMLASYLLALLIPASAFFSSSAISLLAFIALAIVPFIAIGIVQAQLFQTHKEKAALLYATDLAGAATGALLSVYLLNTLSLGMMVAIAVLLLLLTFIIQAIVHKHKYYRIFLAGFIVLIPLTGLIMNQLNWDIPIAEDPSKDMLRLLNNPAVESEIIESRWNAFGKTDLVKLQYPDGSGSRVMFVDGAAGTNVVDIDELRQDPKKLVQKLSGFPPMFAMSFLNKEAKDTALIIGPGGGVDIAAAYYAGYHFIEAVEVNPSFVALMEEYNRPTFVDKDNIKVHVNEGRNFVRNNKGKYDVILLTIPVTKGGRGADFFGLTENYLFTVEALSDYLDGLTADGAVIFTMHGREEVYRMLSNYLELQNSSGVSTTEAMKRIYVISNGMNPVLVIKKQPFEPQKVWQLHGAAHNIGWDDDVFYFPFVPQNNADTLVENVNYSWYMFDEILYGISTGQYTYDQLWNASMINLAPVFDDSPYFFNYSQGIPDSLLILVVLAIAIATWFIFRMIKGWHLSWGPAHEQPEVRSQFVYLAGIVFLLGLGYFFVQGYLFQILNLKLASPSHSFSLLLFTFLLGNGLGSLLTQSFKTGLTQKLMIFAAGIVAVSLLTIFVLLPLMGSRLSEAGIALILLLPSFFIGIPFPTLLKITANTQGENAIPTLLGIASLAGVAASVFAIVVSVLYGYVTVLILGLLSYVLVILVAYPMHILEFTIPKMQKS